MTTVTAETNWKDLNALLRRYIRSRVRNESLIDDLVQETFLKIHKSLSTLKDPERLSHWALTIARRTIADGFRQRSMEFLEEEPASPSKEKRFDEELVECVTQGLLASLPEKYRRAIQRVELDGISQKELAKELGLSISAAKSRVQRARAMMKATLLKSCEFEFDSRGAVLDYHCDPAQCSLLCGPENVKD